MTQQAIEETAAALLTMIQTLSALLESNPLATGDLTPRYISILATHGIRQGQTIAELAPHDRRLYQVSQLVRGLVSTGILVAWLAQPTDTEERVRRAVRYRLDDLTKEKRKALRRLQLGVLVQEDFWDWHTNAVDQVWSRADTQNLGHVPIELPTWKKLCDQIGMPKLYAIYEADSSAGHAGSMTMGSHVRDSTDEYLLVGGPDPIDQRILRLTRAIAAMQQIGDVSVLELSLDGSIWEPVSQSGFDRASEMMELVPDIN